MGSHNHSNSECQISNEKKSRSEEKPEALASPEGKQEHVSKNKRRKMKKRNTEKDAESESIEQPPQVCPKPLVVATPIPEESKPNEPTLPNTNNTPKKRKLERKKKEEEKGEETNEANAQNPRVCPKSPLEIEVSAPPVLQTIPVHPANAFDTEQNLRKNQRRKIRKRLLDGEQPNEHNVERSETPVQSQASICHTPAPPIDPAMDPHPAVPICPKQVSLTDQASPINPSLSMFPKPLSKNQRRKMRKSLLDGAQVQPNEHNIEQPETPVQTSISHTSAPPIDPTMDPRPAIALCPKPGSLIDQTIPVDPALSICREPAPPIGQTIPIDSAIPTDTEQKLSKNQRRKMRKRLLDGEQPNEHNIEQAETPVQTSICHTIPMNLHPATPIDPDQKTSEKKRKRERKADHKSEGEKPNAHIGKPTETPVQKSISPLAAPSTDPTVPIDQTKPVDLATPIDPEQMSKRKRRRMSAIKTKESESDGHNADSTAEAPVQGTKVTVTKAPMDQHSQSSKICWACRRTDHKISNCQMLKSLSKDEEICFFCGEIGHSLGRCSVSLAGGGRFAKCLLCHAHGHFSYDCPGDGHGNYLKVVAANGPIDKTAVRAGREVHC